MRTTFILGAGASRDFGYPLGKELKTKILIGIAPGKKMAKDLADAGNSPEDVQKFARQFRYAHFDTIDEFLQTRPKDSRIRKIGKQAIALCISECEKDEPLFDQPIHWYRRFLDYLRDKKTSVSNQHFSFFTFNYDCSFEHYFHEALTSSYEELSDAVRKDFLHESNFIHVHGSVGYLPWQNIPGGSVSRIYGDKISSQSLSHIAAGILFPDESKDLSTELAHKIQESEIILILGFGMHAANCDRIFLNKSGIGFDPKKGVFISVSGLEEEKREMLREMPSVRLVDSNANNFIADFLRRLDDGTLADWGLTEIQKLERTNRNLETIINKV